MKVLGISGSPRRGGNTDTLLERFLEGAASRGAQTKILYARDLDIAGCRHCDACLVTGQCAIQDDMQMVYQELESADRIALASPLQFMTVTSELKALIDRCQTMWARKYVLKVPPLGDRRKRLGYFISVGGRPQIPDLFGAALVTVKTLFRTMDVVYSGELLIPGIDAKGDILKHPEYLQQVFEAGQKFASPE